MSRPGSRRQHKRFCDLEGWDEIRNARDHKVSHHLTFELVLPDGRILRTRVSRPANNDTYGASLWAAILRDQLEVTELAFWECVDNRVVPVRAGAGVPAERGLPAGLVHQLLHTLGLSEQQIAALTREQPSR